MDINFICITCGTQFAATAQPLAQCPICEDERQFVPASGQQWTTFEKLRRTHRNSFKKEESNLYAIGTVPDFAIGQRALLLKSPKGNTLWDCISLIDETTVDLIRGLGGLTAIAISHPHYYTTMVEWSRAFGGIPVYLHADDRAHVMRPDPCIHFWEGETHALQDGITLIRCGGHFDGGSVLHWASAANGKGALLSGDIIQVVADLKSVGFMYSYPNYIPLSATKVQKIAQAVEPFNFDSIYGAFWGKVISNDGKSVVRRSAERYVRMVS